MILNIPDSLEISDLEARMILATRLYEKSKLTLGQAADLVEISKTTFMDLLTEYNVPIINHPVSDLENDIRNAKNYIPRLGWEDAFKEMHENHDDKLLIDDVFEDEEII